MAFFPKSGPNPSYHGYQRVKIGSQTWEVSVIRLQGSVLLTVTSVVLKANQLFFRSLLGTIEPPYYPQLLSLQQGWCCFSDKQYLIYNRRSDLHWDQGLLSRFHQTRNLSVTRHQDLWSAVTTFFKPASVWVFLSWGFCLGTHLMSLDLCKAHDAVVTCNKPTIERQWRPLATSKRQRNFQWPLIRSPPGVFTQRNGLGNVLVVW